MSFVIPSEVEESLISALHVSHAEHEQEYDQEHEKSLS